MHLVTFSESNVIRIGILDDSLTKIIDVSRIWPSAPTDMNRLIEQECEYVNKLRSLVTTAQSHFDLQQVKLLAPIQNPKRNIICVGKNYREHVNEVQTAISNRNGEMPKVPIFFTKATTSVVGTEDSIPVSADFTASADYEGELGVIIGKGGKHIQPDEAMEHVFGYTIINDVTSRRLQKSHHQWFLGKSLDGFCPMGPCLLTKDSVNDVSQLEINTYVNGELRQQGQVNQMIFDIPCLIQQLSKSMTLIPGDIIATGTPAGVGMGFKPPKFLHPGDKVSIKIDPIGCLENICC